MRKLFIGLAAMLAACGAEVAEVQSANAGEAAQVPETSEPLQVAEAPEAEPETAAEPARNLLTLAEGAVPVSASTNASAALSLVDDDPTSRWNNGGPNFPGPHSFVFELRAPTQLSEVGVVGAGTRPGGGSTASARTVRIEGSSEDPKAGFTLLGQLDAAETGESLVTVAGLAPVRWLRFTVESAHQDAPWVYLGDVVAYGAQTPPTPDFTGVYRVRSREYVELRQQGSSISGCFVEAAGHALGDISGDVVDGVARVRWSRTDIEGVSGPALLVIDSRGHMNGVRYRDRSRMQWSGEPDTSATTQCSEIAPPENPVAEALQEEGVARIYGILFDFDEATLRRQSEPALRQLLAALEANPSMNVDIEGHTDAVGDDAYNLVLSERRAQSVVSWLADNGIAVSRLKAVGRGETMPVAANDTADGRALNRRVEVRLR